MSSSADIVSPRPPPSSPAAAPPRAWSRELVIAIWALVVVGAVLRVVRYAADRSLWGDEGALALNLIGKPLGDLLGTLDFQQGAPTGFLVAEKAAVAALGEAETALRLVPLLSGLVSLVLFLFLVRRALSPFGALVAMALFALSEPLVYYSSEVKQYESDVAVATGIALAAVAIDWRRVTWPRGVAIAAGGALAGWLSHPALIVLGAAAAALLADALLRRARHELRILVALSAVWALSGIGALIVNRSNAEDVAEAALAAEGTGASRLQAVEDAWDAYAEVVGVADTATALAAVVSLAGLLGLWSRHRRAALLLVVPLVLAVTVSLVGLYPSSARFYLFLAPLLIALIGEGAAVALRACRGLRAALAPVLAGIGLLLLYPTAVAADNLLRPPGHEEVRTVLRYVDANWRPGDTLWVWYQSQYPLRYYALCDECDVLESDLVSVLAPADPFDAPGISAAQSDPPSFYMSDESTHAIEALAANLQAIAGKPRVWLVFSSTWDDGFARQQLDCLGRRLDEVRAMRAVGYLYDLSRAPGGPSCPAPAA